ncbi:MAG: SGNH/GDSL hydrolase family protein [Firmicutes bacterium]|nr:SGNH/GDSL hydrolase family protein [Bacillota bacterium]
MFIKIDDIKDEICFQNDSTDAVFSDIRKEPFDIYGLYEPEKSYRRLPEDVAKSTSEGVAILAKHTAGGRLRFTTDSPFIEIRYKSPGVGLMFHMALSGSSGFDLYLNNGVKDTFEGLLSNSSICQCKEDYYCWGRHIIGEGLHSVTVHFPLYNEVSEVYVGLKPGSCVGHGAKYRNISPVVYYGSSITQGGCCSKPGNSYENIISAKMNIDHINLGFSGNGKAEEAICRYIASLNMSVFVMDYDHNAPDPEYLEKTHYPFYRIVRDAKPDLPIIFVTRPVFNLNEPKVKERRDIIYKTYSRALSEGDRNVYFIDGKYMFPNRYRDACSVDGVHPNDLGFCFMAESIGSVIERILSL